MTSAGSPRSQLHRLVRSGASADTVLAVAREVSAISIEEAFAILCCLRGDRRYPAAARRFCERLRTERPALTLAEEAALLDALGGFQSGDPASVPTLSAVFERFVLPHAAELLDEVGRAGASRRRAAGT